MNDIAFNTLAFVVGLGFLIFIHEAGHFFVAKLFRVRVIVFSFGFGKRLFGFKHGDTDYRVSLVPLGGYVRMSGDTPEENTPSDPAEFLSKPKWQRFLILVAGPLMNIVVAIAFIAALAMIGREELVTKPVIGDVLPGKPAEKAGLKRGDTIVSINGEKVDEFEDVRLMILTNAGTPLKVTYTRNGVTRETTMTPERENGEYGPIGRAGITYGVEPIIGRVEPGSVAVAAGLKAGDRILSANGKRVADMSDYATVATESNDKPIRVEVQRGASQLALTIPAHKDADRGIVPQTRIFKLSLVPALRYSVEENWRMLRFAGTAIKRMFRSEGSVKELSGPLSIARISGDMLRRGPIEFVALLAMISLQLGAMNLLPIPVLDGGHIMILLIEGVARRDLSLRMKERIQQLGFAALATLMIVVLYHDVVSNVLRLRDG